MFLCAHIPDFPAEALVRLEPDLRYEAVAVVQGAPPMVTVVAINDRARAAGVESGMTQMQAEERLRLGCEHKRWHIRQRSLDRETAAQAALLDCASSFSPRVEATAPDTVIADISGLEQLFGTAAKIARDLARRCSDAGLEVHVAAATNADAALHAARGYSGITVIPEGEEAERLGPLPLEVLLAPEYGRAIPKNKQAKQSRDNALAMLDTLDRWGVRTLRGLAVLPEVAVVERLGQAGLQWQRFACGATTREIVLAEAPLQFEEVFELEYAVDLLEPLAFILSRMIEQLCARLQSRALATHELQLRLQLDPDVTVDREGIPTTEKRCEPFMERTIKLPVPMLDAKTFLKLLQLDLKANPPGAPVLKLWLRAEPVRPKFDQRGLFLPLTPEPQKLEITLARLAGVTGGQGNVGSAEVLDTHRPDAFRMNRFAPPTPSYEQSNAAAETSRPVSSLRRFRPPQPISVQLMEQKPIVISPPRAIAGPQSLSKAAYGEVVWCAGPWRTSGEWWNKEPWEREEWDVAIKSQSADGSSRLASSMTASYALLYRVYRDLLSGTWFVEGEYD
ncbi:MAG TPA: DNA polymerase Y family protein [Terriglobales bacterium]|nr:DNA polymerase Y family protein [Terriglobales bacterium]